MIAAVWAGCVPLGAEGAGDGAERPGGAAERGELVAVDVPAGALQASVIEITSAGDLQGAVTSRR